MTKDNSITTKGVTVNVSTRKDLKKAIRESIDSLGYEEMACLLCGQLTYNRGLFMPSDPVAYGGMPGEFRMMVFPLCKTCNEEEAKTGNAKVREKLLGISNREETIH